MKPLVVIGGGISGTTCAKVLALDNPERSVILVSSSSVVKMVSNLRTIGRTIDIFDVIEQNSTSLDCKNLIVQHNRVIGLDSKNHKIALDNGKYLTYSELCICTGAKPKKVECEDSVSKYVKTIRDTSTAEEFQSVLSKSKRVLILGNGGIATELIYKIENCEILWVMKDDHFGAAFFDPVVSKFFNDFILKKPANNDDDVNSSFTKRQQFTVENVGNLQELGAALGPDWQKNFIMKGSFEHKKIRIINCCNIVKIHKKLSPELNCRYEEALSQQKEKKQSWNIYVELSNGIIYGCDYVVSAIGVVPNNCVFLSGNNLKVSPTDGGISVSKVMQTSVDSVYAAGDVCTPDWATEMEHWFQMRLWTQARQMGFYAAKCITAKLQNTSPELYFNFDVFTHATRFFGFRVILLGLFNGQKLDKKKCHWKYSVENKKKLVKFIHENNRMKGAVLIGDTGLEETFENMIYNQIDLSGMIDHLLDDVVDIEDYFD